MGTNHVTIIHPRRLALMDQQITLTLIGALTGSFGTLLIRRLLPSADRRFASARTAERTALAYLQAQLAEQTKQIEDLAALNEKLRTQVTELRLQNQALLFKVTDLETTIQALVAQHSPEVSP